MYRELNIALTSDNDTELQKFVPLIRAINNYLNENPGNKEMTLYRGGWLPNEYLKYFIKNALLRVPCYWSMSTSKSVY